MPSLFWIAAVTATASPSSCPGTVQQGVAFSGTAVKKYNEPNLTVTSCCELCSTNAACKAWSFHGGNIKCLLFSETSTTSSAKKATSGVKVPPSPTPPTPTPPSPGGKCPAKFIEHATAAYRDGVIDSTAGTPTYAACCALCVANSKCAAFTWHTGNSKSPKLKCTLTSAAGAKNGTTSAGGATSGGPPNPPPPPPRPPLPAPPLPPTVPAGSQKNVVILLTDDQDLRLGSMRAMPYAQKYLRDAGANMSNFFVHTPICCPSRTTLLSGRWYHNNKVSLEGAFVKTAYGGCMRMNTSRDHNPAFWENSLPARLRSERGYAVGLFGKVLNVMDTYGCVEGYTTPHVDRALIMCNHNYENEKWLDSRDANRKNSTSWAINSTGTGLNDYTTAQIGNASIAWMKEVIESGKDHAPFFAYLGPHAPHKPSTPAPWYADHPIGNLPLPKDPYYGFLSKDKHGFFPIQPEISPQDELAMIEEQAYRLRTLLTVDDLIKGVREYLISAGEWDNTYFIFTSDHGYSLGQYRQDSDKTEVYDHVTRVPFLMRGPGIKAGVEINIVASMADVHATVMDLIAPTTIDRAVVAMDGGDYVHDGTSWAPTLLATTSTENSATTVAAAFARTATLIEYQPARKSAACSNELKPPAQVYNTSCHYHDGPNNTFAALRVIAPQTGDLLYAEFVDGTQQESYYFNPTAINFHELYNVTDDYYMLNNIYSDASDALKKTLHDALQAALHCQGTAECNEHLNLP